MEARAGARQGGSRWVSTPTTTCSSPMVWVIRWNGRASLHFWTRGKVPDSQETAVSGINLSLLKKISENPDLLKILSAIVGSLWWPSHLREHPWLSALFSSGDRCGMFNIAYCYVHSASIFPASWMNRRSFSCPKPWANTRDWMLAINKWFDFPRGLEYNKIVEIAQNSSRNNTYYELRYHTGDVFHA